MSVSLVLWASGQSVVGAEVNVTRTNWFDHWITNVIEVRMPANRFVNEYHTNWVTQLRTNLVDVYATNRVMRTLTNPVVVQATWTNYVTAYETNWSMIRLTNLVPVQATWTNVVVVYQTNWITQPVTNVVRIDVPARPAVPVVAPKETAEIKEVRAETAAPAPSTSWTGPLAIEAARTARPAANNLVEVQLKVRWTGDAAAPLQVQNWRVEREDGAILLFGQDQEFKRQLPVGKYKVEAKLKAEGDNPPIAARGTLSVTPLEATIQQKLLAKK